MPSASVMTAGRIERRGLRVEWLLVWLPLLVLGTPASGLADSEIFVAGSSVQVFQQTANGNVAPIRRLPGSGNAGGVVVDSTNNEVFVTDHSNHAIHVYARTGNGTILPVRSIQGALTELSNPFGMFVDTVHNELIVAESGDDKVLVFSRTANGNVAPIRKVQNKTVDDTGFFGPLGVFVDLVHDELLVTATKLASDAILVFPRTINGTTVAPIRQIPGGFSSFLEGLFVNTATDEIIVAATIFPGEIRVYPRTANRDIVSGVQALPPTRTINGPTTGLGRPVGLDVDTVAGEIIVSDLSSASVRVFPLSGSGDIAPLRVIEGAATGLSSLQMMALGAIPPPRPAPLFASVLPASRSVKTGTAASAFASIINTGPVTLSNCEIAQLSSVQSFFGASGYTFQTTDPATNQITGSPNAPTSIRGNSLQTFVFAFTPAFAFAPTDVQLAFQCAGAEMAPITTGLDTILLSASATAIPDIVALVATIGNNGIVDIPGPSGAGAFAVATVNVGAQGGQITVTADTGSAVLPVDLTLCQTDPVAGFCTTAIGPSVVVQIDPGQTPTFAVFVSGHGAVSFDPANNRVFVRFKDAGDVTRGATSVAARTI
ncbi:MAG: hypothetical protein ACHQ2E_04160 [Gemmatimonadales bacterium]